MATNDEKTKAATDRTIEASNTTETAWGVAMLLMVAITAIKLGKRR